MIKIEIIFLFETLKTKKEIKMAQTTKWSVSHSHNVFYFHFSTNNINIVCAELDGPLVFLTSEPLGFKGSNGVSIILDESSFGYSILVRTCGTEITTAGIIISDSAYVDIFTYIQNKNSIDYSYSD